MKLQSTLETEIYISDNGYVCIKQIDFESEPIVALSPEQARLIAPEILRLAEQIGALPIVNEKQEEQQ